MKARLFSLVLAMSIPWATAQDEPPPSDRVKFQLMSNEERIAAVATMAKEKRQAMIAETRARAIETGVPEQFNQALVLLGDEELLDRLTRQFVEGDDGQSSLAARDLGVSADPAVVRRMSPSLFYEDDMTMGADGYARSFTGGRKMLEIMGRSPAFSSDLRAWAAELTPALGYIQMLILQEWWKVNAAHFQSGHYELVRPGASAPEDGSYRLVRAENGNFKLEFEAQAPRWSPVPPAPPISPVSTPSAFSTSGEKQSSLPAVNTAISTKPDSKPWGWLALAAAAGLGLCVWWVLRPRKNG